MDIRKLAAEETSFLHLRDAADELLFDNGQPVGITLYGPGTKVHAKATAAKQSKLLERLRKKGKTELSAEETTAENAAFLAACTKSFQCIEIGNLTGEDLFKAVYSDASIGFIAEQAGRHLAEWANFKPASTAN